MLDLVSSLAESGILQPIDLYFAEALQKRAQDSDPDFTLFFALLMAHSREGHLCMKIDAHHIMQNQAIDGELKRGVLKALAQLREPSSLVQWINSREEELNPPVGLFRQRAYLKRNWLYEKTVSIQLKDLINLKSENIPPVDTSQLKLNSKQQEAVGMAMQSPLTIISGGPGCGKTYVASQILTLLRDSCEKIVVCAPTGKAVDNIRGALKEGAGQSMTFATLHAHLGAGKRGISLSGYSHIDADLVVVDECSMIDAKMFAKLLLSLGKRTKLILLGDPNQLPPVESGTLFHDLCHMDAIAHVQLEECLRVESKPVLDLAQAVMSKPPGEVLNLLEDSLDPTVRYYPIDAINSDLYNALAAQLTFYDPKPEDWSSIERAYLDRKILCSHNIGPYGAKTINRQVFDRIVKPGCTFALPIMVTRNQPKYGLMNGRLGIWIRSEESREDQLVFNIEGTYESFPADLIPSFDLAFAMTIHKSQGSEYNHVQIVMSEGQEPFGREALYTGITRCRQSVEIYGSKEIITKCLSLSSLKESGINL